MSCERFKTRLTNFALGEGDPELRAHLENCATCRAELETQRALLASIDRGVASMVSAESSGDFAAHVRRRIAQESTAPRPWFAGWVPVTAVALALVVLVSVLTIGRPPRPPQSAGVTPPTPVVGPQEKPREIAPPDTARAAVPHSVAVVSRPPRPAQSAANREPEVLVPRGEMAAVMRLYNANWEGKADGTSLLAEAKSVSDSLKPMAIAELKITALEVAPLESGEQPKGPSNIR
jgi:negative regulator of sigma E activity